MRNLFKYGLVLLWLAILVTPPLIFLQNRGLSALSTPATAFPFFGLIAFTLVWSQIMLGSFMRPLERLYPKIFPLHIAQGLLALAFAVTHPTLLYLSLKPGEQPTAPEMAGWVLLGKTGLTLLILGVLAGLLRNWKPLQRVWHWFHLVHYLVFFLILFHSWNLGGDLQTPALRSLWLFFLTTVIAGLIYRRIYIPSREGLVKATS